MIPVRVITVAGNSILEETLAASVNSRPEVELYMRCVDRIEVLAALRTGGIDALVCIGPPIQIDRQVLAEAREWRVRAFGIPADPQDVDLFGELGLEVVLGGSIDELLVALKGHTASPPKSTPSLNARMIAVWGPKGSPGRSTTALELGYSFSFRDPDTLLVDADPYGGDLRQLAGIIEEIPTIVWASRSVAQVGFERDTLLGELRRTSPGGPILLPGLPRADLWEEVSDYGWRELIAGVRRSFSTVIADVGFCLESSVASIPATDEGRNRLARTTISEADAVVAVAKADPLGLKNFLWSYARLCEVVDAERVIVVANQVRPGHAGEVTKIIRRFVGKTPAVHLPYEPNDVARAVTMGRSVREIRPSSALVGAVDDLAALLGAQVQRRGLLTRMSGKR